MASLSVFCDEAGQQDMSAGYYLLTLVLHDQSTPLGPFISDYESHVAQNGLPDIAFHMKDLLHGHGEYEGIDQSVRKKLLIHFNIFMQKAPVRYKTFVYNSYDTGAKTLSARMRRDIVNFVYDKLEWFQSFDRVSIYYDEGQAVVTHALHEAFDYLLGSGVADFRLIGYQDRRLSQAADYFCSIELASLKYARGEESNTYRKFYGLRGDFKRNFLKQARRKVV